MTDRPTVDRGAEDDADNATPRPLPRRLRQLRWSIWRGILWRSVKGYFEDDCSDFAAAMTYQSVTALIPSMIVIVALINLVTDGTTALDATIHILRELGAGPVVGNPTLLGIVESLLVRKDPAKVLLGFGLLLALWSASGYVGTFTRASNRIYGVREGRKWWMMQLLQLTLAAVTLVLLAAGGIGLVVSGPVVDAVGNAVHAGPAVRTAWSIGRWPVLVVIGIVQLSLLFWIAPNVRQPRLRWLTVGGAFSLAVWAGLTALFGLYVANFGSYNRTYGSLGAIMAFLVWVYLSNIALLLGVQVNAEIQRGRLRQAGDPDDAAPLAPRLAAAPAGTNLAMDRGSTKHNARLDDEMAGEVRGTVEGIAGGRTEEWRLAEPSGEDQPATTVDPADEDDFSRFGSYLGRVFPADREALLASAQGFEAPDDVLVRLGDLPAGRTTYRNAFEVWKATSAKRLRS